jgi:riboflavin kinase/FMN adenylyltransferase
MTSPLQVDGLENARLPERPVHLAVGMFDGVHLGHRAVIDPAVNAARSSGGIAVVLTFWPHPSALFKPEAPARLIQDGATKALVLGKIGVEAIITQAFTPEFAAIEAKDFLPLLKRNIPRLAAVYVGENFRFGHCRRGDVAVLDASARECGLRLVSAPRVTMGGGPVSSTRIRALLESGEIEEANGLLGYPYFASGEVTPGKRLGRTIGFPTLNLPWSPPLRPRLGVYAVRVAGEKAKAPLPGAANFGLRPTVEQAVEPRLEVHVLGECSLGAGDRITVEWLHFIRPEKKFAGVDELRAQIGRDREVAAKYFQ